MSAPSGSPESVSKNPDYEHVVSYARPSYPTANEIVVRHKQSGTLWAAMYAVRDDDSDWDVGCTWYEVEAKQVTRTEYVRKS